MPSSLHDLPSELLLQILCSTSLDFNTLVAFGQTSPRVRQLIFDNAIPMFETAAEACPFSNTIVALRLLALFRAGEFPHDDEEIFLLKRRPFISKSYPALKAAVFRTIMDTGRLLRVTDVILRRKLNHLYYDLPHEHIADKSLPIYGRRRNLPGADVGAKYNVAAPSAPDGHELQDALRLTVCAEIIEESSEEQQTELISRLQVLQYHHGRALEQWLQSFRSMRHQSSSAERHHCNQWRTLPALGDCLEEYRRRIDRNMTCFIQYCCMGTTLRPCNWDVMVGLGFDTWSHRRLAGELEMESLQGRHEKKLSLSGTNGWFSRDDLCFTWRAIYWGEHAFLSAHEGLMLAY